MHVLTDCPEFLEGAPPPGARPGAAPRGTTDGRRRPEGADAALRDLLGAPAARCVPHSGRDLTPAGFWRHVAVVREAPTSQFHAIHDALRDGLALDGPAACLALSGRDFRGQRQRRWAYGAGNLFLAVALPVFAPAAEVVARLVALPVVAVVQAMRASGVPSPRIKWVNDVLVGGRKAGGTLVASHCRGDRIGWATLGIGVNVARTPDLAPTPFVPAAACLRDVAPDVTLAAFWRCLLDRFADLARDLRRPHHPRLVDAYRAASAVVGQRVRVFAADADDLPRRHAPLLAAGVVEAIDDDLSLRLEGVPEPVSGGRLAYEDTCREMGL